MALVYDKNGNIDIEYITNTYFVFDKPVPYKDFLIYPIQMKNYFSFISSFGILDIDKNDTNDIAVIQMSYLDFIMKNIFMELHKNDGKVSNLLNMLFSILHISLKISPENVKTYRDEEKGKWHLILNDIDVNSKDFDEIRRIILYQNVLGYDENDKLVDPALRKAFRDYQELKSGGYTEPPLEKQISVIQSHTGFNKSDLLNMTFREFKMLFNTVISEVDYTIMKSAEMSGFVKFNTPVSHWVYEEKQKNKYAQAFMSLDSFKNKMANVT